VLCKSQCTQPTIYNPVLPDSFDTRKRKAKACAKLRRAGRESAARAGSGLAACSDPLGAFLFARASHERTNKLLLAGGHRVHVIGTCASPFDPRGNANRTSLAAMSGGNAVTDRNQVNLVRAGAARLHGHLDAALVLVLTATGRSPLAHTTT
jgi:hypothetical protein